MLVLLRHLVWFFLIACLVAYTIFLVLGTAIHASAIDASRTVIARDAYKPGQHGLSGMVMVPLTCEQLVLNTQEVQPHVFELRFTTWEEPYVACDEEDTPRSFRAVVFAPAVGISYVASLDGTPLNIVVMPEKIRD